MNENPWHIDDIARMQRERIQEEMREIRMAEAASKPHAPRRSLAAQLYMAIRKWLHPARKAALRAERQPQARLHAKRHARA